MHDLEFVGDYRNPQQLTARQRELGFDGTSAGEFTFDDFLDIINPLQHIPVVSTLYRAITGDEISPHARIFGDTLFGGPAGFLSAAATSLFEEVAGEDIGETVLALFTGESGGNDPQVAEGDAPPAAPPPGTAGDKPAAALPGEVLPSAQQPAGAAAPLITAAGPATPEAPADPTGAAVLPATGGPGMLTGQDALSALFNDLTRGGSSAPRPIAEAPEALPLPGRAAEARMQAYPLPPRPAHPLPAAPAEHAAAPGAAGAAGIAVPGPGDSADAALHPLIFAQNAAGGDLADRMMQALDKYAVMTRQRREDRTGSEEETRWRADPALHSGES